MFTFYYNLELYPPGRNQARRFQKAPPKSTIFLIMDFDISRSPFYTLGIYFTSCKKLLLCISA